MSQRHVFLCDAIRTPIGKFGGSLAHTRTDDLAAHPIKAIMARHKNIDWDEIGDVFMGCANQAGEDNRNVGRMAGLLSGLPLSVGGTTINRLCGSGMDAIAQAARQIKVGEATMMLAGGVESMSRAPFVVPKAHAAFSRATSIEDTTIGWRFVNPAMDAQFGTDSMPETAENVAEERGIARADQDAFAVRSQQRAAAAQAAGILAEEIAGIEVPAGRKQTKDFLADEHPRADVSGEALAGLKPIVKPGGTVTAGNASGVNDGAGIALLADERSVDRYGLKPLARIVAAASAGVEPRVMGLGPVPAVRKVLSLAKVALDEVGVIELNEAFAAQALGCLRAWGLPDDAEHVNPNGGAIALGHPLGMSGLRIAGAAAREMGRRDARYGLATMCIGVGQGIALLLERP
ncbi:MAG: 3-oxoadipyl-CoA thiolase [Pseudomonadota bacterium]